MSLFYISNFKQFESTKEIYRKLNKNLRNETFEEQLVMAQSEPSHTSSVIDNVSIIERNINMVMKAASVTKEAAFKAIRKNNWSVKAAIYDLCRTDEEKMEEPMLPMPLQMEEMLLCSESEMSRGEVLDEEDVFIIDLWFKNIGVSLQQQGSFTKQQSVLFRTTNYQNKSCQ